MRDDVIGFLDAVGIDRCVLIGHSMGGIVSALVAEAVPDRLTRLVLEGQRPAQAGSLRPARRNAPEPPPATLDWAVVHMVDDQLNDPDPAWWADAGTVDVPTLVVAGGPGSSVPQHLLTELADQMPDATLVTIASGHDVHAARPAEFLAEVRRFLRARPRQAAAT
jgi:pimeloyl-ACP methyl ester carboxylesterase